MLNSYANKRNNHYEIIDGSNDLHRLLQFHIIIKKYVNVIIKSKN